MSGLFTIKDLSIEESKAEAKIDLNPDHEIYTGHFPGNPVTPGVCQLQIIQEIAAIILNKPCFLGKAKNIKFLNVLAPLEKNLEIKMEYSRTESGLKTSAVLSSETTVYLKFTGQFFFELTAVD